MIHPNHINPSNPGPAPKSATETPSPTRKRVNHLIRRLAVIRNQGSRVGVCYGCTWNEVGRVFDFYDLNDLMQKGIIDDVIEWLLEQTSEGTT